MQRVYSSKREKGAQPWEPPVQKRDPEGTLFSQKYLTVVVDEVHEMRNVGAKYFSAMQIFKQGAIKLALTATPLLTSPKVRRF